MTSRFFNKLIWIILFLFIFCISCYSQSADLDNKAILEKIKSKAGLCLVIGAKDSELSGLLAKNNFLYIQVIQPDQKLAFKWAAAFANSEVRENIGVRNGSFDPKVYGSDLFNLIIVEEEVDFEKIKFAEFIRMLVPNGNIFFKKFPKAYLDEAKMGKYEWQKVGNFEAMIQKPILPIEWKICDSFKWRAGPRAQFSGGWKSEFHGDSKFFYREMMEIPGTLETGCSQFFARDGFNGRVLWTVEEKKWPDGPRPTATSKDKVFLPLDDKLVCLDSNTGVKLFELMGSGLGSRWSLNKLKVVDDLVLAQGEIGFRAFSVMDGKEQWKLNGVDNWISHQGKLITSSRGKIQARDIKDPNKILWTSEQIGYLNFCSDKYVHLYTKESWRDGQEIVTLDLNTGVVVWSYAMPKPKNTERSHTCVFFDDKFYICASHPYENKTQDLWVTRLNIDTGKLEAEDCGPKGADPCNMCAPYIRKVGKFVVFFFSVWIDLSANTRVFPYLAHPSCGVGPIFADGLMFNTPSHKSGALVGISAMGPADIVFDHEPGGKIITKVSEPHLGADAKEDEWPMFRCSMERGNNVKASINEKPIKIWETQIGLGGKTFGVMSSERTGLTQPIIANGLAIVSDMDAQRVVALNIVDGKQKWVFPVGSRVDFPPAYYKGLCLVVGKDGWVYCINADTGTLAWKLLVTPQERFIGGQDKIESQWPMVSDVLLINGVGFVSAGLSFDHLGGARVVAFKADTGEIVWSQTYFDEKHSGYGSGPCANMLSAGNTANGLVLLMGSVSIDPLTGKILQRNAGINGVLKTQMDDVLAGGNSIPRNGEDRVLIGFDNGYVFGKAIAFDKDLSVASTRLGGPETWKYLGKIPFFAKKGSSKENLWEKSDFEMTVDDLVLTPKFVFCIGHYQRVKKEPELLIYSREDGALLNTIPIEGFPVQNGMSAAGSKLYISTREGKLMCFEGKQ